MANTRESILWAIIAIDLGALVAGIYYYWPQLQQTPWYLWLFVPHSPFYPTLAAISLFALLLWKRQSPLLDWVASAGMLKYGIWTMAVIVWYGDYFLAPAVAAWFALLFLLHVGEALEGLAFTSKIRFNPKDLPIVLGWFLLGDFLDYGIGSLSTHPILPIDWRLQYLAWFTVALSVACTAIAYWLSKRRFKEQKRIPLLPDFFQGS